MAQYKVPQDVEADDKLLGPFSFRQFVYLMIAGGLIALAAGFFQLFPVLAIIPLPFILLFGILALPLKKDQPMETYLVAIVSYYLKPKNQIWKSGQRETTIEITAPKIVEVERTRNLSGEEATHRLSFLADIVDTGGQAIKDGGYGANAELVQEARNTQDMFEASNTGRLDNAIQRADDERHNAVIQEMRNEIEKTEVIGASELKMEKHETPKVEMELGTVRGPNFGSSVVVRPDAETMKAELPKIGMDEGSETQSVMQTKAQKQEEKAETFSQNPSIIELANNSDYSVATIAKEANRIKERMDGEVFISLH